SSVAGVQTCALPILRVSEVGINLCVSEVGINLRVSEVGIDLRVSEVGINLRISEVGIDLRVSEVGINPLFLRNTLLRLCKIFVRNCVVCPTLVDPQYPRGLL